MRRHLKPDLGIKHILITIKCLLIFPNPESALNEEAGKLLLEQYDTYFNRAKLYTEIHASQKSSSSKPEASRKRPENSDSASSNVQEDKKRLMTKDKKRTLKRL